MRNVVLFSGDGGVGKTVLLMQLAATTVLLDKTWLGMRPAVGPVLYLGAEDDRAELRRRFDSIAKHYGVTWEDLFDAGLRTRSFAGLDALLASPIAMASLSQRRCSLASVRTSSPCGRDYSSSIPPPTSMRAMR